MRVTVVIPTIRARDSLDSCLDCATAALDGISSEIYVISAHDVTIKRRDAYYVHSASDHACVKRNLGLFLARGEFIHFLDDDDFVYLNFYKDLIADLTRDPHALGATCSVKIHDCATGNIRIRVKGTSRSKIYFKNLLFSNKIGTTSSVMLRRSALEGLAFDENLPCRQDFELWLRVLERDPEKYFIVSPDVLLSYSQNSINSISKSHSILSHGRNAILVTLRGNRRFYIKCCLIVGAIRYILSKARI